MNRNVFICGTGNLATALGKALTGQVKTDGWQFMGWISRTPETSDSSPVFSEAAAPVQPGDLVFILTPDRLVHETAARFQQRGARAVHCSGSVAIAENGHACDAVWWPLQTFTKGLAAEWQEVPVFIESADEALRLFLNALCMSLGANPVNADSQTRAYVHLCAVVANNFSNAMFVLASGMLANREMNPDWLLPIIRQTGIKAAALGPENAQTGPARRGDLKVLEKHIKMLENQTDIQSVYTLISEEIRKMFNK